MEGAFMRPKVEYRMPRTAGRHFLQIPGPTNVPDRVLRAIDFPTMDHRGPDFAQLGKAVLAGMKRVFKSTKGEAAVHPPPGPPARGTAPVTSPSPRGAGLLPETEPPPTLRRKM